MVGCSSGTLRHSMWDMAADDVYSTRSLLSPDVALDFKKVIKRNLELKKIAESYNDTIMPTIQGYLDAVVQCLDDLLSGVAIIRHSHISSQTFNEKKKNDVYSEIVAAESHELMLCPSYLAPGTLEETMDLLRLQMDKISKRQRSMKRQRKFCTVIVTVVAVGMLVVSIGLAFAVAAPAVIAAAAPAAIAAAASGAAAIKAVEPLVNLALEEKERKLKEAEEVVEMLRDGEQLMVHEFDGVRRLTEEIMNKYSNFAKHILAVKKAAPEMVKRIDEIESNARELRGKIDIYCYKIEQFQAKFIRMIKN